MGLFSGKLMSDKKAKKLADARAQYEAAIAASPGALNSVPGADAEDADWEAYAAEQMAERKTIENVAKRGVEAPAVMHSMRPTGTTGFSGAVEFEFDVTIEPPSGGSHRTKIRQQMLPAQVQGLADGGALTVKFDPDDPSNANLIGW